LGLEALGEFLDFFGFLDDAKRKNFGRWSFLEFVAQFGSELLEAFNAHTKHLFIFQKTRTTGGGSFSRIGVNFGRIRCVSGLGLGRRRRRILSDKDSSREHQTRGHEGGT